MRLESIFESWLHGTLNVIILTTFIIKTSCFLLIILNSGRWTKSENAAILCVIHHRQNPIESTCNVLILCCVGP
jgi:hypothetical protein